MSKEQRGSLAVRAVLGLLWVYRHCISPLKPACCRFRPTCSEYAAKAIVRHGVFRGGWLALRRVLRCHPFYRGPLYDPVPERTSAARKEDTDQKIVLR